MKPYLHPVSVCRAMAAALAFIGGLAHAAEPTAFDLIKEANQYVGVQSKDKLVQLRSEKSIGTLEPNIWYVVFYDPDTTFRTTEVKFGAGKKLQVSHPLRSAGRGRSADKVFDRSQLNTDSDRAIHLATSEPLLKSLKLVATQLWLERDDVGPVWKVRLWASKLNNPTRSVNIGDVYISATDGSILRTDLRIKRVD